MRALLVLLVALCCGPAFALEPQASEARAALTDARALHATGQRAPALRACARAMRLSREADDPQLSFAVAREAERISRRLGANDHAMAYVRLAQEELKRGKLSDRGPNAFDIGELPAPSRLATVVTPYVPPETPFGLYSHRATVAAFRKRVKEDPAFLADLTRLKEFRDDPATTIVGTLEYPGVYVEQPRYFKDDYKAASKALGYYKFALKLGRTLDDEFALATLYVNLTVLRTYDHPVLRYAYGLTKTAAIAEAASRIIGMHVTGGAMDLTILALNKLVIDVVRRYDRGGSKSSTDELLGFDEE